MWRIEYVLECIDQCDSSQLLPVIYPSEAVTLPGVYFVWSEIIVSPDEHIAWSTLSSVYDNVNFLGKLVRNENTINPFIVPLKFWPTSLFFVPLTLPSF